MKAIITVGISGSGKTTWAEGFCKKNGYININRDNVRFSVFGAKNWSEYTFTNQKELMVSTVCRDMIAAASCNGLNLVVSDTNLSSKYRDELVSNLEYMGYKVEFKIFDISWKEACKRDSYRIMGVGKDVLYRQWKQWLEFIDFKTYVPDLTLEKAIICDIDGTVATACNRSPFEWSKVGQDSYRTHVTDMVYGYQYQGYKTIFLSGRDSVCKSETVQWLKDNNLTYSELYMRKEGDMRADTVIKEEFFWPLTSRYNITCVIDDRNCMTELWQDLGLNVISVGDNRENF